VSSPVVINTEQRGWFPKSQEPGVMSGDLVDLQKPWITFRSDGRALNPNASSVCLRRSLVQSSVSFSFWFLGETERECVISSSSLCLYLTPSPASASSFEACHHGAYAQQWVSKCRCLTSCFSRGFWQRFRNCCCFSVQEFL
jgi:hypothetical protein